jgi:hypothetical protein
MNLRHNRVLPVPTSPVILMKPSPLARRHQQRIQRFLRTRAAEEEAGVRRDAERRLAQAEVGCTYIAHPRAARIELLDAAAGCRAGRRSSC